MAAPIPTHAEVHSRQVSTSWGEWLLDSVTTGVKGIARNFFPIYSTDSASTQGLKWAARVGTIAAIGAVIYFFPWLSLVAAVGVIAFGLLAQTFSHTF